MTDGIMYIKSTVDPGGITWAAVCFASNKEIYERILSWEKKMNKKFASFIDDITTTVIDNAEIEEDSYLDDRGNRRVEAEIFPGPNTEILLLRVIKKHLKLADED